MGTTISGDTGVVFPDATTQSTAVTVATPFSINASAGAGAQLRLPEATANGVNYVAVKAADALAGNVTFTLPTADGTNGQVLQTNGSGALSFVNQTSPTSLATPLTVIGDATAGAEIRLPEDTDNGSNYVALKAPNSLASNLTLTLPSADGTNGQVLQTNGSGTLSFGTAAAASAQEFAASGTWTKPSGASIVIVECWGAGGGGGAGGKGGGSASGGGGGGGGGGFLRRMFLASELPATVSVTIGSGATGGTGTASVGTTGPAGNDGGATSFGAFLVAYGGKGGNGGNGSTRSSSGGVGGGLNAAAQSMPTNYQIPVGGSVGSQIGRNGSNWPVPLAAEAGGGTGGFFSTLDNTNYSGGKCVFGGAGGGAGGGQNGSGSTDSGSNGGTVSFDLSTQTGGGANGASGGGVSGSNGSAGAAVSGFVQGSGGGGGSGGDSGNGGRGGNGGLTSGGGGGGGTFSGTSGTGGTGGNGYCRVYSF